MTSDHSAKELGGFNLSRKLEAAKPPEDNETEHARVRTYEQ
jgi:hypothetical protein